MTIYSFHLFDRHCEQVYQRIWRQETNILPASDLSKLIFGTVFSLRNAIRKLTPDTFSDSQQYFHFHTDTYSLHCFESLSLLRFVIIASPPLPVPQSSVLHPIANAPQELNYEIILRQIYERLYVEYVVKNPLTLPVLYEKGQLAHLDDLRFGKEGSQTKSQRKRKSEITAREGDQLGAMKGIALMQGCDMFAMALDSFFRTIDS